MLKKLGQHFLINKTAIKKIISALKPQSGETIFEIGPGKGALTFPLLQECQKINCKLIAVEKDPQLGVRVEGLGNSKNFEIIIGDALKEIPKITKSHALIPNPYKIVGNIPYYITGKLLRILSELKNKPTLSILMVQKEVAKRITAKPPKMNLLSAAVQFWSEPKILLSLKPEDFNPPPKVNSAVIKLNPKPCALNPEKYYKLLHIIFKQPRKTLINNLRAGLKLSKNELENKLKAFNIEPNYRGQNLSVKQLEKMALILLP